MFFLIIQQQITHLVLGSEQLLSLAGDAGADGLRLIGGDGVAEALQKR